MAITSQSRVARRIAVGEEARRINYRTSTFQARNATPHSIVTIQQHISPKSIGRTAFWFLKQISPGLIIVLCFVAFRNLDRRTQLQMMAYAQEAVYPETKESAIVIPQQQSIPPRPRLGARVPTTLDNLADLSNLYNPRTDTAYFWDVHFAGETIAESVFSKCHFLILACEHGLKQPEYNDEKLEVFETPNGALYVNVDSTTKQGIRRAKQLGLADARLAEVMTSPELHLFVSSIFNRSQKGRMFALFRDPINRAVSMYHYLSTASWDPLYDPALKIMTIEEYAQSASVEHNWMTRFLVNKPGGKLNKQDMLVAKEILRTKCLVGIYEDLENSLKRFQLYFGWSRKSSPEQVQDCRTAVLATGDHRHNTPELEPGTKAYLALAIVNKYDMELYAYAKTLYRLQGEQIFGIVESG
jgi:hypothetical protein